MSAKSERVDPNKPTPGVHEQGTSEGNEVARARGREPGRASEGKAAADRPSGGRDARDATGINPDKERAIGGAREIPPA